MFSQITFEEIESGTWKFWGCLHNFNLTENHFTVADMKWERLIGLLEHCVLYFGRCGNEWKWKRTERTSAVKASNISHNHGWIKLWFYSLLIHNIYGFVYKGLLRAPKDNFHGAVISFSGSWLFEVGIDPPQILCHGSNRWSQCCLSPSVW